MASEDHIRVIQFFFAVALLLAWYFLMYKKTRADRLREDLFTIRDELFDYMWRHEVSYDLAAYQQMRNLLNGGIRFAEMLHLTPLTVFWYITRGVRSQQTFGLLVAIEKIQDPATKAHFIEVQHVISRRLFRCAFLEGPYWPICKLIQIVRHATHYRPVLDKPEIQSISEDLMRWGMRKSPEAQAILCPGTIGTNTKAA